MKIFIIGNSAKAYSLAKKLSDKHEIFVTPSSDTLKEIATCADIREDNVKELLEFAMENGIDMTIPISEKSIKSNIAEIFTNNKLSVFGASAKSAEITFDKALAKKVLYKLKIPTPKFGIFEKENVALDYIKNQRVPFVIKTNDSNSAVVITSAQTGKNIINSMFIEKNKKVIIEDYVYGCPFSFYTITDGYKALPIGSSLTYKHSLEGEGGQLTSGMGACSPNYKLSNEQEYFLMDSVIYPTLEYLEMQKCSYLGILGVNGIISDEGQICILGWQSFMLDCDTQAVLDILDEDLYPLFNSCIIGSFSDETEDIRLKNKTAVSIVISNKNKTQKENVINGLDNLDENTMVSYYPEVTKNRYLEYEAAPGNVAVITALASTCGKAAEIAHNEVSDIHFDGMYYRKDICKTI